MFSCFKYKVCKILPGLQLNVCNSKMSAMQEIILFLLEIYVWIIYLLFSTDQANCLVLQLKPEEDHQVQSVHMI